MSKRIIQKKNPTPDRGIRNNEKEEEEEEEEEDLINFHVCLK
jgi:hypothetical protein